MHYPIRRERPVCRSVGSTRLCVAYQRVRERRCLPTYPPTNLHSYPPIVGADILRPQFPHTVGAIHESPVRCTTYVRISSVRNYRTHRVRAIRESPLQYKTQGRILSARKASVRGVQQNIFYGAWRRIGTGRLPPPTVAPYVRGRVDTQINSA